ncbi:MAG: class I SAM-dependent methyltransferase [Anaerolineaceae bacterium]|nr:class I SAM-dependent methyltransferase [Anaerolineaceae bacterium]
MNDLFPAEDFDDWAADYDEDVETASSFPFDGYAQVLRLIVEKAAAGSGAAVMDLGIGTGNLAERFARQGCQIWGLDFSAQMLVRAASKLPGATLGQADLRAEWPQDFQRRYDAIVSAYTFHHFTLPEKAGLVLRLLQEHLAPGGRLVIGDVSFGNAKERDSLKLQLGDEWEDEYYWLADETSAAFAKQGIQTTYLQVSFCAGVFEFVKR